VGVEPARVGGDAAEVAQEIVEEAGLPLRPDEDRVRAALDAFEAGNVDQVFQSGVILTGLPPEFNATSLDRDAGGRRFPGR
jgi:hypothetical protein